MEPSLTIREAHDVAVRAEELILRRLEWAKSVDVDLELHNKEHIRQ